jgi:hypothetical protein
MFNEINIQGSNFGHFRGYVLTRKLFIRQRSQVTHAAIVLNWPPVVVGSKWVASQMKLQLFLPGNPVQFMLIIPSPFFLLSFFLSFFTFAAELSFLQ